MSARRAELAALSKAINDAPKEVLVAVLTTVMRKCSAAIPIMNDELLTDNFDSDDQTDSDEESDESDESNEPALQTQKRKRATSQTESAPQKRNLFERCVQCMEMYNVVENDSSACQWHPGTFQGITV